MHRLEAVYFHFCTMTQGFYACPATCHSGCVAHIVLQGVTPDRERILDRLLTFCRVNDEINLIVFDRIGDVRTPFHHLIDRPQRQGRHLQSQTAVPLVAQSLNPKSSKSLAMPTNWSLSGSRTLKKTRPSGRDLVICRQLRLTVSFTKSSTDSHHLTGGLHLRS